MSERVDSEDWRVLAELASKEENPAKLMEIAARLIRATEQQSCLREDDLGGCF
jgi:hypothetical protein